jgi:hypothetical protein
MIETEGKHDDPRAHPRAPPRPLDEGIELLPAAIVAKSEGGWRTTGSVIDPSLIPKIH